MASLTANVSADATEFPTDTADPAPGSTWTIGSESISVQGSAWEVAPAAGLRRLPAGEPRKVWLVERGFAGSTKATHSSGATLTQYYADAPAASDGPLAILQRITVLTDAQIKALPTTAIELVPAPGAGQFIAPLAAWFYVDWHADYTNLGDAARIGVGYTSALVSPLALFDAVRVGDFLADGASHVAYMPLANYIPPGSDETGDLTLGFGQFVDEPAAINAALELYAVNAGSGTGDFTGGHASNAITVTVWYGVVDVT